MGVGCCAGHHRHHDRASSARHVMLDATATSRRGNKLLQQAVAAARACLEVVSAHDVRLLADACDSQLLQRLLTDGEGAVEGQDVGLDGAFPEGVPALVAAFERQLQAPAGSDVAMVAPPVGSSPVYDRVRASTLQWVVPLAVVTSHPSRSCAVHAGAAGSGRQAAARVRGAQEALESYVAEQGRAHSLPELHTKEVGRPGRKTTVMEVRAHPRMPSGAHAARHGV